MTSITLAPDDSRHGTLNGYTNRGCRCADCRLAIREYHRARRAAAASAADADPGDHVCICATCNASWTKPFSEFVSANQRRTQEAKRWLDVYRSLREDVTGREREIIDARLAHPDASLSELGAKLGMTKDAVASALSRMRSRPSRPARTPRPAPVPSQIGTTRPHGTRSRYVYGCRCQQCRDACAAYQRTRRAA